MTRYDIIYNLTMKSSIYTEQDLKLNYIYGFSYSLSTYQYFLSNFPGFKKHRLLC